jgi:hypothetical protein
MSERDRTGNGGYSPERDELLLKKFMEACVLIGVVGALANETLEISQGWKAPHAAHFWTDVLLASITLPAWAIVVWFRTAAFRCGWLWTVLLLSPLALIPIGVCENQLALSRTGSGVFFVANLVLILLRPSWKARKVESAEPAEPVG